MSHLSPAFRNHLIDATRFPLNTITYTIGLDLIPKLLHFAFLYHPIKLIQLPITLMPDLVSQKRTKLGEDPRSGHYKCEGFRPGTENLSNKPKPSTH